MYELIKRDGERDRYSIIKREWYTQYRQIKKDIWWYWEINWCWIL
jgi:hypothetical protein